MSTQQSQHACSSDRDYRKALLPLDRLERESRSMSLFSELPGLKRVPNFVGLDFEAARELQVKSGFGVRDPDPDAPAITNRWWSHRELVVVSQIPSAGLLLSRDERVSITIDEPRSAATTHRAARTPPPLDSRAHTD